MLKQLLKYEFKATKSLYFGLYLALALLSVVLGVTFRQEHALAHSTSFQNLEVILMIVYVSVILAIAVLCFVNTIQRFYQNLLGREGYLMHTLPVNENQLILSKLLTSMVWVLCSGLVGIVCITANTMQRALAQLESEGLVRTERTSGRYVTEDTNLIEQLRAAAAHDIAADFLEKMRSIGYTPEKAAALLEHWDTEEVEPHE